jgi:chromosome segregation ATPase
MEKQNLFNALQRNINSELKRRHQRHLGRIKRAKAEIALAKKNLAELREQIKKISYVFDALASGEWNATNALNEINSIQFKLSAPNLAELLNAYDDKKEG